VPETYHRATVINARTIRCRHRSQLKPVSPDGDGCAECLAVGDEWVHLRMCLTCGAVRCCDSSPNQHASRHAKASGHPIVRSMEPGESWMWCYVDEVYIEPI
jgi:uncharacterized UBP type Zn finger protein